MKSIKTKDISNKTVSDLAKMIMEKREALRVFRFGGAGAKQKNVKLGRGLRKDIARLETQITAKRHGATVEA